MGPNAFKEHQGEAKVPHQCGIVTKSSIHMVFFNIFEPSARFPILYVETKPFDVMSESTT